jgi:hypothetical protein
MKKALISLVVILSSSLFPEICLAVDESSSAYKTGRLLGYVLLIAIVVLVIRKILKGKS